MAQKTVVQLVSDLTGEEIGEGEGETVRFGLDGADYETDLFTDQAEELRKALEPFVQAARRTGGRAQRGHGRSASSSVAAGGRSRSDNQKIRAWAREQGLAVNERGRVPSNIVEAYEKSGAA